MHILILAFLFTGITVNAQSAGVGGTMNPNFGKNFGTSGQQQPGLLNKNNLHFSMQLGTSFSSSGFGTALTNFVSPTISYRVSEKFSLQFGATIRNSFIDSRFSGDTYYGTMQPYHGNVTYTTLWASGTYQVNERLILRGTVYKDFSMFDAPAPNNPFSNVDSQGAILDMTWRPSKNVQVGLHMEYHQGYNPFRNPYGYGMSPFGYGGMSPMGRGGIGASNPYLPGW